MNSRRASEVANSTSASSSAFFEGQGANRGLFETGFEPATSRIGTGCSTAELRPHMARTVTCIRSALSKNRRTRGELDIHQLSGVAGFAPAHPLKRTYDNPDSSARRKWHARWESNPRVPNCFGRSFAVELRGDQDGQVALQIRGYASGTRTRITGLSPGGSLTVSNHPFGLAR